MTKRPLRRRRIVVLAFPPVRGGGVGMALFFIAALALLFAFSDVTLYDLVIHPLRSLGWLAGGLGDLVVASFEALPHLLTAAALWLAGLLAWRLLVRRSGARP